MRKTFFGTGPTRAEKAGQKSLVLEWRGTTNQGRTHFICTLWIPICLSFNSPQGRPLSVLSGFNFYVCLRLEEGRRLEYPFNRAVAFTCTGNNRWSAINLNPRGQSREWGVNILIKYKLWFLQSNEQSKRMFWWISTWWIMTSSRIHRSCTGLINPFKPTSPM
jgi:hypothetical protein